MPGGWDLRSNIGPKQNSQGTLFRAVDKSMYNPQVRWPRGYTPERLNEVRVGMKNAWGENTDVYGNGAHSDQAQRARVEDTIARSTMPASHLFGLETVDAAPDEGTVGTYRPRQGRLSVDMHSRNEGDQSGQTLIHEMGHHVAATNREHNITVGQFGDKIAEKPENIKPFLPPSGEVTATARVMSRQNVERGLHEGAADNYMVEHYRTRGRKGKPVEKGAYEQHQTEGTLETHYPGYRDIRPKPPTLGPQWWENPQRSLF